MAKSLDLSLIPKLIGVTLAGASIGSLLSSAAMISFCHDGGEYGGGYEPQISIPILAIFAVYGALSGFSCALEAQKNSKGYYFFRDEKKDSISY